MRSLIFLTVLVFVAMSSAAWARIGETLDQCISRYGQPAERQYGDTKWLEKTDGIANCQSEVFVKGIEVNSDTTVHVRIFAVFVDGICEKLRYRTTYFKGFTQAMIDNFLSLNGWIGDEDNKYGNPNLLARATSSSVVINTKRFQNLQERGADKEAGSQMKGF